MAFWSKVPECLDIDYEQFMIYYKKGRMTDV